MAAAGAQQQAGQQRQQQQQPFRMVLVAYSMGGLVARRVVHRLAADPTFGERPPPDPRALRPALPSAPCKGCVERMAHARPPASAPPPPSPPPLPIHPSKTADMGQLVALLTLGSPDHFPAFMPHAPLSGLLNRTSGGAARRGADGAEAAAVAAAVPRVNILAGAGDFSLPLTHAAAAGAPQEGEGGGLTLAMRDMPGVWATCSHKVRERPCRHFAALSRAHLPT